MAPPPDPFPSWTARGRPGPDALPNDRLRVLFVSHAADLYGAGRSLCEILRSLDRARFEPLLACPRPGPLVSRAADLGVPCVRFRSRRWTRLRPLRAHAINLFGAWQLARFARAHRIDLVYSNSALVIAGGLAARWTGVPHVWHVREAVSERRIPFRALGFLADALIANSRATERRLARFVPTANITTVYNAFRSETFARDPERRTRVRRALRIPPTARVLACAGSLCERKGQRELLLALPRILDRHPETMLLLAGRSPPANASYEATLRRIVAEQGLAGRVRFLGFQEDVADLYQASDILVLPARYEAFGRVVVEAMLAGLPVIATAVGGIPEIVEPGRTGVLLPSRDPEALATATLALLSDPCRMRDMGERGRESARRRFGGRSSIQALERVLLEVCGAKRHRQDELAPAAG